MQGIIIFADDNVLNAGTFENKLFQELQQGDEAISVLPVCSLASLEVTLKAVSTFKALILDWNFEKDITDEDGIEIPSSTPEDLLNKIELYSLVYVYSQNQIDKGIQEKFKKRFPKKIKFKIKSDSNQIAKDAQNIKQDIQDFEESHKYMEIPFEWSRTINQEVQKIFNELEQADPHWIQEIRDTAKDDGGEPISEIIDVFQHILNESLIQNPQLRKALEDYNPEEKLSNNENVAKLYRRIFYSKFAENSPIMTGEILRFDDNEYGVLITPECEISKKEKNCLEFLKVEKQSSNAYQETKHNMFETKPQDSKKIFNNGILSRHILPSFPFVEEEFKEFALIDFSTSLKIADKQNIIKYRTNFKLNTPYIQQLRQRFVSFFGRYGVPATPNSLREYHLR